MSVEQGRDYIYLIWKNPKTREHCTVGKLSKNGNFEFSYVKDVSNAIKYGFKPLLSFEDVEKTYTSDILFPVFSSRLPDKKRNGIKEILLKYDMKEFDDYQLLKKSGAKLPIDDLQFIVPISDEDEKKQVIEREFYLAGTRYYIGCDGKECEKAEDVSLKENVYLVLEPSNEKDKNAVKVVTANNKHIGYVPNFYSEKVGKLLNEGREYTCTIHHIQKDHNCSECIKIKLEIRKKTK